jgi:hypothetical protein
MTWEKFKDAIGVGHEVNYFFELRRKTPDEAFLYIRALIPYRWIRGKGEGSYLGGPIDLRTRYIEVEWPLKLPAVEKVPPERGRYKLITWWATWEEAKTDCEKRGGHLVTIDSDEENGIVTQLLKDSGYPHAWIGLSDKGKGEANRKWEWVTTTNMKSTSYRKWDKNQPDKLKEYYVDIRSDGTWNDYCQDPKNKDYKMPYVCEFEVTKLEEALEPEEKVMPSERGEVLTKPEEAEDKPPKVFISVTPEKVRVGETFRVLLKAEDDVGLQSMWWWGESTGIPELDKDHTARIFGKSAASTWRITATKEGTFTLAADARDSAYPTPGEAHQASEGEGIGYTTITVTGEEAIKAPVTIAKLKFWSAFDNHRKTDLCKYRVTIKLNDREIFSGTPPSIQHAIIRKLPGDTIHNFKPFEITFDESLLQKGRNKLEVSLSGVDHQHWFCWNSFSIGGTGVKGWSYHPATDYDDTGAPLGILAYRVSSGRLWPYMGHVDGVHGGESTMIFFAY